MIRRSTVVYIVILLTLAGVVYFLNTREQTGEPEATTEPTGEISYLFPAEEGVPISIAIKAKTGETVGVARNEENAWMVTLPIEARAEQGSSEAAASQITTMRVLDRIPQIEPEVVGLKEPEYVLNVRFNTGTERTVYVGVVTPTESGYYVQDSSGGEVLIVSKSSVDSLLRMLSSPPYAETPTPSLP
jgi:hypothetical protein